MMKWGWAALEVFFSSFRLILTGGLDKGISCLNLAVVILPQDDDDHQVDYDTGDIIFADVTIKEFNDYVGARVISTCTKEGGWEKCMGRYKEIEIFFWHFKENMKTQFDAPFMEERDKWWN